MFPDVLTAQAHVLFRMKANLTYRVHTELAGPLPTAVRGLFGNVTEALISCPNDPFPHRSRLVSFRVGKGSFLLLTERNDLTTYQVIVLSAYRWHAELLFRFLKRTLPGIHLINHAEHGVPIQFDGLLIVARLHL